MLVGHAAQQPGRDGLPGQLAGPRLVNAEPVTKAGHRGLLPGIAVVLDDVKNFRHGNAHRQAVFAFGAAAQ